MNMNTNYFDLYYNFYKNRDDKQEEEINTNESTINYLYDSIIMPNYGIGIKPRETILRWRKMRSQINHFKLFVLRK